MDPRLGKLVLGAERGRLPAHRARGSETWPAAAIVTETVCFGLVIRDTAMVAGGAPARLRRGPAFLLPCRAGGL